MDHLIEIRRDVFDISDRLKEINPSYKVMYNRLKGRFELHGGREMGLILVIPFDRLDARAEEYVRKTRIERLTQIAAEIEEHNSRKAAGAEREAKSLIKDMLKESADRVYHERDN
ncbi:MAG: hypothetical protein GX095_03205 [Clostridiales bacterium]|jgi:spore coat protein CotH|nr:hypothetical protein [Clostridiales bacterium]HOK81373.1 hypothetical protein [Clostridia bacterium]HOL60673.1 hypothetical protein [Clostridia bacterium]HPO53249.1 hypothetical protein [Clostridia bacterium]